MRSRTVSLVCTLSLAAACSAAGDVVSYENLPDPPAATFASTPAGIALGRRLFFDPMLSWNGSLSCASCHDPARAFTDGVARSNVGASGATLARNAPGLTNIAWAEALFWDGGAKNLESLVLAPLTNPDEMNQPVGPLIDELAADPTYVEAFTAAFPEDGLVIANVMRALAQYMRTLVSADSRYDRFVRLGARLSASEQAGLAVYQRDCATCHATDLFTDNDFHNNGLDDVFPDEIEALGRGRARVTLDAADLGAFRTPTLRNLGYTAPYMHDGRLATLEDVLEHYRFGVLASATLDPRLVGDDGAPGIAMTDEEAANLLAFLRALDDPAFVARHAR